MVCSGRCVDLVELCADVFDFVEILFVTVVIVECIVFVDIPEFGGFVVVISQFFPVKFLSQSQA